MSILVLGSLNMDLVARVEDLPHPGETLAGESFQTIPGGKGGNQAVAAARLGAAVKMIGRVGADSFGPSLVQSLQRAGVDTSATVVDAATHTGVALIAVSQTGQNQIIVIPGANGTVGKTELTRLKHYLPSTQLLLLQFEIPFEVVQAAARLAKKVGVTVMLDPAPARPELPSDLYENVDILTPNQTEAAQLVGFAVDNLQTAQAAAQTLRQRGVSIVIVKLGSEGVVVATAEECFTIPAFEVDVVDTVAAGDAFNGGLAVALSSGQPLRRAVTWANAVAALSVTQAGAQPSMPTRLAVETFLANFPQP